MTYHTALRPALLFIMAAFVAPPASFAQETPSQTIHEESAEDRQIREIAKELRCAVCQSESVADSGSTLARNMREVIRDKIREGESSSDIKAYFVSKYGDYILMEPRKTGFNWLLWLFPLIAILAGGLVIALRLKSRTPVAEHLEPPTESDAGTEALVAALRAPVEPTEKK